MRTGPTTRDATEADAHAATDVLRRSITELCSADHRGDPAVLADWLANKTPERFEAWIARPGQWVVVAERGGVLCGVGLLRADGGIRLCYVHPEHARRGVGRALIDALEARAREAGLMRLHLDSTITAAPFYEAMGYRRCGNPSPSFAGTDACPYDKRLPEHARNLTP